MLSPSPATTSQPVVRAAILATGRVLDTDTRDVSKVESRKLVADTPDFDLGREIERVLDQLASKAEAKGIELASFVDSAAPARLRGVTQRLKQVLAAMIGYAVDATARGGVLVRTTVAEETALDALVQISVWCTGETDGWAEAPAAQMLEDMKRLVKPMRGEAGHACDEADGFTIWFTARFSRQIPLIEPVTALAHDLPACA